MQIVAKRCASASMTTPLGAAAIFLQCRRLSFAAACVSRFPKTCQPYLKIMRADKPTGTLLLYWPCTWGIALGTTAGCLPDVRLLGLFAMGSFFMRSAGCIVNDLYDRDLDRRVARTKDRPLASNSLTTGQAVTTLAGLLSCSLAILLQLNQNCFVVGASSLALVFTYPLFKRFTYWPQLALGLTLNWGVFLAWVELCSPLLPVFPLYAACVCYTIIYDTIYSHQKTRLLISSGLTFNWGVPLGWVAACSSIDWNVVLPLYAGSICWTLIYDTIYAHQDKTDDLIYGVKSTALKFGDKTKPYLAVFGAAMSSCLVVAGVLCDQTFPYYAGVAFTTGHIAWQIASLNINDPDDCWRKFNSNRYIGIILFLSIVGGNLLKGN